MSSTPVKLWRYVLPSTKLEGWAEIVICSSGFFAAVSDYGDYAFAWRATGYPDVREFFLRALEDWDYFARKLGGHHYSIYDGEATESAIRAHILEERRGKHLSRGQARTEWYLLEDYEVEENEMGFGMWLAETNIEDAWEFRKSCVERQLEMFCKKTMARLAEAIRTELLNECIPMKSVDPRA